MRVRLGTGMAAACGAALWMTLAAAGAQATPVPVEAGWSLVRTVEFQHPNAAHFNPVDGKIYVNRVAQVHDGGGVYRIEDDGSATQLAGHRRPRGLLVDHGTGNVFFSEGRNEGIYQVPFGTSSKQPWVTGFAPLDDDPIGMAAVPDGWLGDIMLPDGQGGQTPLLPGMALVVDEGFRNADRIWAWSLAAPEGEKLVHESEGDVGAMVDVAFTSAHAYVADISGYLFRIEPDGSLVAVPTSVALDQPSALVGDPVSDKLYVLDQGSDRVLRIDPDTGDVEVVLENFTVGDDITDTAGLDVSPDGRSLFVTDRGSHAVYVFQRVPEPTALALFALGAVGLAVYERRQAR